MNFFRKLRLTLNANLEDLVDKVENHEAVAESLIHEVEKKVAKLRIELNRIRSESSRLHLRIEELCRDEQLWKDRATRTYSTDRPKALECAKRTKEVQVELQKTQIERESSKQLERNVSEELTRVESTLTELRRKRSLLTCRQSCAEVLNISNSSPTEEIDDIFKRWELSIVEKEIRCDHTQESTDVLDLEFKRSEQDEELDLFLESIVKKPENE